MNEQKKNRTPLLLRLVLFLILPYDDLSNLTGDFEELHRQKKINNGIITASCWVIYQIMISTPGFIVNKIYWGTVMFKNYLLTTFRNIKNQKGYSFINITGLAIGFACSMMIMLYIQYELSFDKHFDNANNIYRVCSETSFIYQGRNKGTATPAPLAKELMTQFPEVLSAVTFDNINDVLINYGKNKFFEDKFFFADPALFNVFSLPLVKGNAQTVLSDPASIVISETMAAKYFGNKNPVGETITIEGEFDFIVTGIIKDIPGNSHFDINFIVPLKAFETLYNDDLSAWYRFGFYTYFQVRNNADLPALEAKIQSLCPLSTAPGREPSFRYFLQPLTDIHLYSDLNNELATNNDIRTIYLFGFIALLILLIACINYINLSTSRSVYRAKEIGVRKVVGAQKNQIMRQFISESLVLTLFSAIFAIILVITVLPYFNLLVERNLDFNLLWNVSFILPLAAFIFFSGIGAGFYPALVMSSFKPVSVLRGKTGSSAKGGMIRNIFVVTQFSISIILIVSTLVVEEQLSFIRNKDVGYKKDQILTIPIRDRSFNNNINTVKAELLSNPDIEGVSFSAYLPNNIRALSKIFRSSDPNSESLTFYQQTIDFDFIDLYDIEILEGRNFSTTFLADSVDSYLVNETAVKALGFDSPIGKEFYYAIHGGSLDKARIIGVMKDFHMHSLYQKIEPLYCKLGGPNNFSVLSIKILPGDLLSTIDYIKQTFEKHSTKYPFEYNFFDEIFNNIYKREQNEEIIFSLFAILAIFIACLGLLGLVSFIAVRRTKEIGIRKVFGASVPGILVMLLKDFIKLVLIANIIAWPIAYYFMNNWLQDFAYRTELSIGIFIVSGMITLAIACFTILYQAVRAAVVNPVNSLRYE